MDYDRTDIIRRKLGSNIKFMGGHQGRDGGPGNKQHRLEKDLTAVITNTLFREYESKSCPNFFKRVESRNNTIMRLTFLPGKTEIAIK